VVSTLRPELFATGHDPDNYPGNGITFQFQVYSVPAGGGSPALVVDSGQLPTGNYLVPSGKLSWNQTYYWTVRDYDTIGYSAWSTPTYFSTTVPQPLITSHLGINNSSGRDFDPGVGDYTTSVTDANVPVVGPPLVITRSYNSLDPRTANLFGAGWSTVYDMSAVPDNDGSGNVVVTYPDGHTVRFGLNADGTTFAPPQGTYATFQTVSGGGYSLTARGGTTYLFTTQSGSYWKLTKITDADGRAETLTYDGSGDLTTVTNTASHHSLHFTWSGGHVTSVVTDPVTIGGAPLTWTYGYSGNYLLQACAPNSGGKCTAYGYPTDWTTAGSLYRPMVLDAQPYAYWRLADTSGATATDEVAPNLGTENGTYVNMTPGTDGGGLPGSPTKSGYFGGTNASVALPNNLVASSTFLTVQLWFQTAANGPGGVLFSTGHSAIGSSNPNTGAMPVLYVGSDGKLYGQFWTGSVAPVVSAGKVNDAAWHQVTLTAQGTTQAMYLDGALVGSRSGQVANLDPMDFVGAGYINTNPWVNKPASGWSYFTGNIAEAAFYTHALGAPAIAQQYSAATNVDFKITSVTTAAGAKQAQITYDDITDRATAVTDIHGGTWTVANPSTTGSSANYRGAVIAADPTDFWPLTDTTGTQAVNLRPAGAEEASADSFGTYSNVTLGAAGPFPGTGDTAASFNGTSSSVSLPVLNRSFEQSLGVWFKTTTSGATLVGGSQNPLLYVGADGKIYGYNGNGFMSTPQSVTDGKWHFVVLIQGVDSTGDALQWLYLDGGLAASATGLPGDYWYGNFTAGSGAIPSSDPAAPGSNPHGYFTGSLADIAFYNNSINASAVSTMWQAAHLASASPTPITTVTATDPGNATLKYTYDPGNGGRLIAATDGLGNTTSYSYDTNGFLYTTTHPDGNYTTTTRDTRGNVLSTIVGDSMGNTATSYDTYPAAGTYASTDPRDDEPLTFLSADSAGPTDTTYRTNYTYSAGGDLLTTTSPTSAVTPNTYTAGTEAAVGGGTEPPGLLATHKDALGNTTTYSYDAAGDLATTVAPSGLTTNDSYDQLGRRTSTGEVSDTFPNGVTTSYGYDAYNRLLTQTGPATTDAVTGTVHTPQATNTYDVDGDLVTHVVTDSTGGDASRTTTNAYNGDDELTSTTDPLNRKISYTYDAYGNKVSRTDPAGSVYAYTYDPDGHQLTATLQGWTGNPINPSNPTNLVVDSRAYDPDGFVSSDTDSMGRTVDYQYDQSGRLISKLRPNFPVTGGTTNLQVGYYSYDAAGNPTWINEPGNNLTYEYDADGRVSLFIDSNGRKVSYTYNAANQVASAVDPIGTVTVNGTTYGSASEETDYGYDSLGDVTAQTVKDGSTNLTTTYNYDQRGLRTSMIDPRGNASGGTPANYTTGYTHDAAGQLTTVTGATVNAETNGGTPTPVHPITEYGYDTFGDTTSVSDPDGNITSNTYDVGSQLLGVSQNAYTPPGSSQPITPTTKYTYTVLGEIASVTDPLNNTSTNTYDQLGNLVERAQPSVNGNATNWLYTYDTNGEQLSATDPTGAQTQATYDPVGEQLTATHIVRQPTTVANTTAYGYDPGNNAPGEPTSITVPGGQQTSLYYDGIGDVLTSTDALNHTTTNTYDTSRHIIQTTYADNTAVTASYDPAGRQVGTAQLDASGTTLRTTSTGHDPAGNVIAATDANGNTTTYSYDAANRMTQQVQPVSSTASITTNDGYDAAGQRTRYTDGDGNTTTYTYNPLRLPESTVLPGVTGYTTAANTTTTRSYDADGNLVGVARPGGVTQTMAYDTLGRLTSAAGSGAEATTTTRTFGYDQAGRITSLSTPTGTDAYAYNDAGRILSASGPSGSATYTYNTNGQLTSRADPAGTATFSYDAAGNLATAADPLTTKTATYTYNSLNQPTGVSYGTGTASIADSYNTAHQLTGHTLTNPSGGSEASVSYGYDGDGHVTSKTTTGTTAPAANTYGYDQAGRLTSWTTGGNPTTNYAYDASGNRTQAGSSTYTYDARDQLASSTSGGTTYGMSYTARGTLSSIATGGTTAASYTDDAFDQMLASSSTSYSYDSLGRLSTAGSHTFSYDGTGTLPVADGTQTFDHTPDGRLLSVNTGSGADLAFTDQHNDVTGLYTATGTALTGSVSYDPFGNTSSTTGTSPDVGYQGGWTDPTTGFTGTASRWYSPSIGAFTSRDTTTNLTGTAAAANPYTYANDAPLNNTDPTGHSACTGSGLSGGGSSGSAGGQSGGQGGQTDTGAGPPPAGPPPAAPIPPIGDPSPIPIAREALAMGTDLALASESACTVPVPSAPSRDQQINQRANETPINEKPSGPNPRAQGWTPQPGTQNHAIDGPTSDAPPKTDITETPNPELLNAANTPHQSASQPRSVTQLADDTIPLTPDNVPLPLAAPAASTPVVAPPEAAPGLNWDYTPLTDPTYMCGIAETFAFCGLEFLSILGIEFIPGVNGIIDFGAVDVGLGAGLFDIGVNSSVDTGVAAESGGGILANQAAGNAARDAIAEANPGSLTEQTFPTDLGARRVDVLTAGRQAIESKVGRTSLTSDVSSQIAKDQWLMQNGDVASVRWVFSRSGVTGQIGPTGPLADALDKAGIPWTLGP
jgi:RHS repeat-associated protein